MHNTARKRKMCDARTLRDTRKVLDSKIVPAGDYAQAKQNRPNCTRFK